MAAKQEIKYKVRKIDGTDGMKEQYLLMLYKMGLAI